jgi:hypothetical protein
MTKPTPIRFDTRWDFDSAYIRFNFLRPLSKRELTAFRAAVTEWSTVATSPAGINGVWLRHIEADDPESYSGELGNWMQYYLDFGTEVVADITQLLEPLLKTTAAYSFLASIWVGSDYEDWPYPD